MSKEETIEHLFRMHYGAMFRLAVAMLHDSDEAKDAVSEVFARLFRDNTHLPKKGFFKTKWISACKCTQSVFRYHQTETDERAC